MLISLLTMPSSLLSAVLALACGFGLSAALTPLVRWWAYRLGYCAEPRSDRWHRGSVALLGGYAIAAAALVAALPAASPGTWALFVGPGLMAALGGADDHWHFRAATKLVWQIAIAAVIIGLVPNLDVTGIPAVDYALSLLWIIGITNAFNLLDNMDGLSIGVAAIAAMSYLGVLGLGSPLAWPLAAFAGAAMGFALYNLHPSSIFMGDSGSLFLGSFLATAGLIAVPELESLASPGALVPVLILLLPICDTAFVTLMRPLAGRNPMVGGLDHLSHRLVALGLTERRAVLALHALAALGGLSALAMQHWSTGYASVAAIAYVILLAMVGVVLGHVQARALDDPTPAGAPLVSEIAYRTRAFEVALDVALLGLAYYASFRARFLGPEFRHFLPYFAGSLPLVIGAQVAGLWVAGKYRHAWRRFGLDELMPMLRGIALGHSAAVIGILYLYRFEGFSRMVFALDAVLMTTLLVGSRVAIAWIDNYLLKQRRQGRRVLVYGAGRGGAMLVRELLENRSMGLMPIGFVDDDHTKRGARLQGLPVLGSSQELDTLITKHRAGEVLISIRGLDRQRLADVAATCSRHAVPVRTMRFALEELGPLPVRHGATG